MKLLAYAIFAVCILAVAMFAFVLQAKPNVTGTWKMDPQKSNFGGGLGPAAITIKFQQKESVLTETLIVVEREERRAELTYTLDGKETENQIEGRTIKSTARWEGTARGSGISTAIWRRPTSGRARMWATSSGQRW